MNKQDVVAFFDHLAPTWDAGLPDRSDVISIILDHARIGAGQTVLDVGCGTGVLFPYYLARGAASVTGIDLSPEMARIAAQKAASNPTIRVVCGDVETYAFAQPFDRVVVYNAFPHFPDAQALLNALAAFVKPGGRLTIAHGLSREAINVHHAGEAARVSNGLMPAEALAELFEPHFDVDVCVSNARMYQVAGWRKPR